MTFNDSEPDVAAADRRQGTRDASLESATITIDGQELVANVENESPDGMFLVLKGALEVQVEVGTGESRRSQRARLVRVTTLPGNISGWGLEGLGDSQDN